MPFTARIERAHSYRARSASKKGTWPHPPSFPSLLVFPSREGGLIGLPLRASNEGLLRSRVARAKETNRLLSPLLSCWFLPASHAGSNLPASNSSLPLLPNP